jgi:hypothetical protein
LKRAVEKVQSNEMIKTMLMEKQHGSEPEECVSKRFWEKVEKSFDELTAADPSTLMSLIIK